MQNYTQQVVWIMKHLLTKEIRQEAIGLQIGAAYFERMRNFEDSVLKDVLFGIFTSLNYWRNNTIKKEIPLTIMRSVHIFFTTFMITHGAHKLIE